ncbi:MAG: VPLPA-CTERM sorting domain-containing protein [Jhaorihella sp.]
MKFGHSYLAAGAVAFSVLAGSAGASTLIYDHSLTPSSGASSTTFFDDDNDFSEFWDFSGVAYTSIDRFELTLQVSGAKDESGSFLGLPKEDWRIRAQGSAAGPADDLFAAIVDGTNTYTIDMASDGGGVDVFAHSVATGRFDLWLAEESSDFFLPNPSITVSSARLQVFGEIAAVPLPAGLPLLAGALGGLVLMRRRKRS